MSTGNVNAVYGIIRDWSFWKPAKKILNKEEKCFEKKKITKPYYNNDIRLRISYNSPRMLSPYTDIFSIGHNLKKKKKMNIFIFFLSPVNLSLILIKTCGVGVYFRNTLNVCVFVEHWTRTSPSYACTNIINNKILKTRYWAFFWYFLNLSMLVIHSSYAHTSQYLPLKKHPHVKIDR